MISQESLNRIFPAERTDAFFDALYGGAEEGAYDIFLTCKDIRDNRAQMAFELRKRPGKCLKCSLTYGLPEVFKRHPLLNLPQVAEDVAKEAGLTGKIGWNVRPVQEVDDELHIIPFEVYGE